MRSNNVIKQEQRTGRNNWVVSIQLLILNIYETITRISVWQDEVKDEVKVLWLLFRCFLKSLDAD